MNPDTYDHNVNMMKESPVSSKTKVKLYGLFRKTMKETCPEKNRKRRTDENGVDLNRNFPVCFSIDEQGSSGNPCSDMYRGSSPFSENETQTFLWFLNSLHPRPSFALSLHSYGRSLLHPYSCKSLGLTLNETTKFQFEIMTKEMLKNIQVAYSTGQAWRVPDLYTVNGDIIDYLFHYHSIPGFNIELPPQYPQVNGQLGFWPSLQTHRQEVLTLLWNGWRISTCHPILYEKSIQNRGYSECKSILVTVNEKVVFSGNLSTFDSIELGNVENNSEIVVDVKDMRYVWRWNEKSQSFQLEKRKDWMAPTPVKIGSSKNAVVLSQIEDTATERKVHSSTMREDHSSTTRAMPSPTQRIESIIQSKKVEENDEFTTNLSSSLPQQSYSHSIIVIQLFVLYCILNSIHCHSGSVLFYLLFVLYS